MIRLQGRRVNKRVRAFVAWLETVIEIRHEITLHFWREIYGGFTARGVVPPEPFIEVAVAGGTDDVLDTIAHELCHYEQWRDGREINERGVKQRAAALVRRWKREAP